MILALACLLPTGLALATPGDLVHAVPFDIFLNDLRGYAVAVAPEGLIYVGGSSTQLTIPPSPQKFVVVQLTPDLNPDPNWGDGGLVTTTLGSRAVINGLAVQPDGKLVAAGATLDQEGAFVAFALARYLPNGSLDSTFGGPGGTPGTVVTDPTGGSDGIFGVAVQKDGRIVVAGATSPDTGGGPEPVATVARYQLSGALDPAFGTGGLAANALGATSSVFNAVALQKDGKIVAAGTRQTDSRARPFVVARFLKNGKPDGSFKGPRGTHGFAAVGFKDGTGGEARAVALQADGSIVAAGNAAAAGSPGLGGGFALARFKKSGALDTSFGGPLARGLVITSFEGDSGANGVAIQSDGKIVVAGTTTEDEGHGITGFDFAITRHTKKGLLDSTFGTDGRSTSTVDTSDGAGKALALLKDGSIIVAGYGKSPLAEIITAQYLGK